MPKKKKARSKSEKDVSILLPNSNKKTTPSDISGSYTGTPAASGDYPEQDVDDL